MVLTTRKKLNHNLLFLGAAEKRYLGGGFNYTKNTGRRGVWMMLSSGYYIDTQRNNRAGYEGVKVTGNLKQNDDVIFGFEYDLNDDMVTTVGTGSPIEAGKYLPPDVFNKVFTTFRKEIKQLKKSKEADEWEY